MNSALIIVTLVFISIISVVLSAGVVLLVMSISRKRRLNSEQKEEASRKAGDPAADTKED